MKLKTGSRTLPECFMAEPRSEGLSSSRSRKKDVREVAEWRPWERGCSMALPMLTKAQSYLYPPITVNSTTKQ